jgi:hypothetical protein
LVRVAGILDEAGAELQVGVGDRSELISGALKPGWIGLLRNQTTI